VSSAQPLQRPAACYTHTHPNNGKRTTGEKKRVEDRKGEVREAGRGGNGKWGKCKEKGLKRRAG